MILSFQFASCQNKSFEKTPKEFISKVNVPKRIYSSDSLNLVNLIKEEIRNHRGGYFSKAYDDSTEVIIDSILYSPNFDRLAFFIIDKKENKKTYPINWTEKDVESLNQNEKLSYNGYHYTGKAYIGIRKKDSLIIDNFFRITTAKYENIDEAKLRLKQLFFEEYSAVKEAGFEYNIDDVRFWKNKNVWNKIN